MSTFLTKPLTTDQGAPVTIVCSVDDQYLKCETKPSDRFVYSRFFTPLNVRFNDGDSPILSFSQKNWLIAYLTKDPIFEQMLKDPVFLKLLRDNNFFAGLGYASSELLSISLAQTPPTAPVNTTASSLPGTALDIYLHMLRSELGYLFLDRTRIRPTGFAVGEHVYALSLAPAEEVVLEQKTFSKRQLTLEEQTEQEKQFDIELSSTLSTEMQEGLERQKNLTNTTGFTAGGSAGGNIEGVDVSASASYSNNVSDANNESRTRSLKTSTVASSKTASKYRTLHKTTFHLSTEQGFESTSKRVFRNPNKYTPIQLHYFKILQVLQMSQERYGVRLCWAPRIKGPGYAVLDRIQQGKDEILAKAQNVQLPPKPLPPPNPNKPPKWVTSAPFKADKFSPTCGMSHDYEIEIDAPADYIWDSDAESVKNSVTVTPDVTAGRHANDWGWKVAIDPWVVGNNVKLTVHVGARESPRFSSCGEFDIQAGANFIADLTQDPGYQRQYDAYIAALTTWQQQCNDLTQAARDAAQSEADQFEKDTWAQFNPVVELMSGLVHQAFPPNSRDQAWEVELWRNVFDWDSATYILYPSWWSDAPLPDHTKGPNDFVNASWARLFIPVRLGFELMALRWIYEQSLSPRNPAAEATFTKIEQDIKDYRRQYFGDENETHMEPARPGMPCDQYHEQFICLGQWEELMPTDGTHLEVVQSMTSAADSYSLNDDDAAAKLRAALLDNQLQEVELKKKALTLMTGDAKVEVNLGGDGGAETS